MLSNSPTHAQTSENEDNNPPPCRTKKGRYCRNKSWKNQEQQLKMVNEDSCSCTRYNNNKICINMLCQGRQHWGGGGGGLWPPPLFCVTKRKKGDKGKKERVSKHKLLKSCNQVQNIIVLTILECLEFENFSCRSTMVADNTFQCSMTPPLWNPFRRPCVCSVSLMSQQLSKTSFWHRAIQG